MLPKNVILVTLIVKPVLVDLGIVVIPAHQEDTISTTPVFKFAQPTCLPMLPPELVIGVTIIVVNVPDNTKVTVSDVLLQDINTTTTVS
jgi:hypothetical protein